MGNQPRILLVDDDAMVCAMYGDVLKKDGCSVVTETSAEIALSRLMKGEEYDLVITDIMMARMDGWQFLSAIRNDLELDTLTLPVIVMSAFESATMESKALALGASGCLTKPVKPIEKLIQQVRIQTGRARSKFNESNS